MGWDDGGVCGSNEWCEIVSGCVRLMVCGCVWVMVCECVGNECVCWCVVLVCGCVRVMWECN